ncbi:Plasmodium exported protein, unknown function, partial [Plasmodium vivax]
RSLDKRTKIDEILEIYFQRSLAKHEYKKNLESSRMKERLPDHRIHTEIKNKKNISTYGHLNKEGLNKLDAYKKSYKNRYAKKKWLAKLDCYCEKKVFDKLDNLYKMAEILHYDKKSLTKKLYNKYGIRFIIFAIVPLLGLIIPILFNENNLIIKVCETGCSNHTERTGSHYKTHYLSSITSDDWKKFIIFHDVFFAVLCIIIPLLIIYSFIKFIKYESLKVGKCKMNAK